MAKEQANRNDNSLAEPVRRRRARRERWQREGERPLGHNLAMIGVLGWLVVTPDADRDLHRPLAGPHRRERDLLDREPAVRRPLPWLLAGVETGQRGMSAARLTEVLRDGAPFVLLGALLGAGYFAALRLNVERYLSGRSPGPAVALHLGRLLLAGVGFVLIAQAGAVPCSARSLGFLLARSLALRGTGI